MQPRPTGSGFRTTRDAGGQPEELPIRGERAELTQLGVDRGDRRTTRRRVRITDAAALVRRLAMVSGVFNLVWVTVVVLMIVRPGSPTGV